MGVFNNDITQSMNNKWTNIIQLFDLPQLVTSPTRVTQSSSTIIHHVYTSNPENITETFVPYYAISDHFPVCLSRKVNVKYLNLNISPPLTAVSRNLMNDLSSCLESFKSDQESVDEDFAARHTFLIQCLDRHAPMKYKRVKSSSLPVWYVPENTNYDINSSA